MSDDLFVIGKNVDTGLYLLTQTLSGSPSLAVMLGINMDTPSVRAVRVDAAGRMLVNASSQRLDIINQVLLDAVSQVFAGASVFRRTTFYVQNANASIQFRRSDNTLTPFITAVPNVPLVIEGLFTAVLAQNFSVGVPSTLQAVLNSDALTGQ